MNNNFLWSSFGKFTENLNTERKIKQKIQREQIHQVPHATPHRFNIKCIYISCCFNVASMLHGCVTTNSSEFYFFILFLNNNIFETSIEVIFYSWQRFSICIRKTNLTKNERLCLNDMFEYPILKLFKNV